MQRALGIDLEVPDDFGHWLAGLTDGEGYFLASIHEEANRRTLRLRYGINLRSDDASILEDIKNTLGVGRLHHRNREGVNPQTIYQVDKRGDLYHVIVPLFEKFPLRSKKSNDFEVWKELVRIHYSYRSARPGLGGRGGGRKSLPLEYWHKVIPLAKQLREGRRFIPKEVL